MAGVKIGGRTHPFESRRLKAEVEEPGTGEKGENRVFGWRWMGHGVGGAMRNSRTGSRWQGTRHHDL